MHTLIRNFASQELRRVREEDRSTSSSGGGEPKEHTPPVRPLMSGADGMPVSDPLPARVFDTRAAPPLRYHVRVQMMSEDLQRTFVQSTLDEETDKFLKAARVRRYVSGYISDLLYSTCLSRTSANALTFRGGMFVLSKATARRLLLGEDGSTTQRHEALTSSCSSNHHNTAASSGSSTNASSSSGRTPAFPPSSSPSVPRPAATLFGRLLDIGAGDGGVTASVAPLCEKVIATEASMPMKWRLWGRGYTVTDDIEAGAPYDGIALFNVLDRADKPWSLLRDMRRWVKPDGTVIMAVVLPWCPFVEVGNKQQQPAEQLPMNGARCADRAPFELCVQALVDRVITPVGFEVVRWTRVPYLCEGSAYNQYYALDDVVLVMRPRRDAPPAPEFPPVDLLPRAMGPCSF